MSNKNLCINIDITEIQQIANEILNSAEMWDRLTRREYGLHNWIESDVADENSEFSVSGVADDLICTRDVCLHPHVDVNADCHPMIEISIRDGDNFYNTLAYK